MLQSAWYLPEAPNVQINVWKHSEDEAAPLLRIGLLFPPTRFSLRPHGQHDTEVRHLTDDATPLLAHKPWDIAVECRKEAFVKHERGSQTVWLMESLQRLLNNPLYLDVTGIPVGCTSITSDWERCAWRLGREAAVIQSNTTTGMWSLACDGQTSTHLII